MARTVYKGTTTYKDPVTGSIYVDRQPSNYQSEALKAYNNNVVVSPATQPVQSTQAQSAANNAAQSSNSPSPTWSAKQTVYTRQQAPTRAAFTPSDDTNYYYDLMRDTEDDRPGPFESRYEGAIQSILDGILNRKPFDAQSDANYNLLYNQMRESYMNAGNKAMRDTMGAMQAATGGYGSTAATAAGSQAYDNYLQGMNDQNMALMQLAYQMYGDETADRYNQLGAVTGLDNTDYGRYRDTVSDWQLDRDYYANQYQNFYGNDWDQYKYNTDRDWDEYVYNEGMDYQMARDALSDYDDAFNQAYKLTSAGQKIPERYASFLEGDTLSQLNALAAQVLAEQQSAAVGSGGGSGRGGKTGGSSTGSKSKTIDQDDYNAQFKQAYIDAYTYAKNDGQSDADARKYASSEQNAFAKFVKDQGYTISQKQYKNASDLKRSEYEARKRVQN